MNGIDKSAALLMALGEDLAGDVLKHLKQPEIHKVTAAMVKLEKVSAEDVKGFKAPTLRQYLYKNIIYIYIYIL